MKGSQSMKVMWIGGSEPLSGDLEKTAASRRTKNASENYTCAQTKSQQSYISSGECSHAPLLSEKDWSVRLPRRSNIHTPLDPPLPN